MAAAPPSKTAIMAGRSPNIALQCWGSLTLMPQDGCWTRMLFTRAPLTLMLAIAVSRGLSGTKAGPSAKLILEVINRHFTVGRKIRSVYLRVYSDGTAESHTVKYTGDEADVVKQKTISSADLQSLQAVLDNADLHQVKRKYGLTYTVVDSWMEWDIRVPHGWHSERIKVLNFSPGPAGEKNQPYPPALVKLGCLIWKVRNDVYGDESLSGKPFYRLESCRRAIENQVAPD